MNSRRICDILWAVLLLCLPDADAELPSDGTGSAYAYRCNAAKQAWQSSQGRTFLSETTYNSTVTGIRPSTSITTQTILSSDSTPFTLCDGHPRINGSRTIMTVTTTTPYTTIYETSSLVYRNLSQPRCTIQSSDCARLEHMYAKSMDVYSSSSSLYDKSPDAVTLPSYPSSPICGSVTLVPMTSALGQPACAMQGASVRLLYWPVAVTSTCDSCQRKTCSTTTLGPTIYGRPNTFKTLNTTLTSPTVYIEFEGSWAYTSQGTTFSTPQTLIIAQRADAVSSYCGKPGGGYGPPRKVNYADFNEPVPADVYRCQPSCFVEPMPFTYANITATFTYPEDTTTQTVTGTQQSYISQAASNLCSTIWNDYAPVLSIPDAFKTIHPAGFQEPGSLYGENKPCDFIFNEDAVLFDPPLALIEQSEEAKPTLPHANSAYPTPTDTDPTAAAATTSEPIVPALPESPGLTLSSNGPIATVFTDPEPIGYSPVSSHAIGDVIASIMSVTTQGQGQGESDVRVTLAMASDGSEFVVNGVTTQLGGQAADTADDNEDSPQTGIITIDGNIIGYTSLDGTLFIGGQTLSKGETVVLGGTSPSSGSTTRRTSSASQSRTATTATTTSGASNIDSPNAALGFSVALVFLMTI